MHDTAAAITALKAKLGSRLCIMGHHYENDAVVRHCDITGDSLELARRVPDITAEHIVFCGVYFMGESAVLLAKDGQQVHLPAPDADCAMSLMSPADRARKVLRQLHEGGRKVVPVAYVNTTLALKAVVGEFGGAVCTSANARTVLQWALDQGRGVLFLPDRHLGRNTGRQLGLGPDDWHLLELGPDGLSPDEAAPAHRLWSAQLLLWPGCCPIHDELTVAQIAAARAAHPGCLVMAHPECRPEVIEQCDGAGSTSFLIREAARLATEQPGGTLIVGTEINLVERLGKRHAGQCTVLPLGPAMCPDMAKITEDNLLSTLRAIDDGTATPLTVDAALCPPARESLTRMLDICAAQ